MKISVISVCYNAEVSIEQMVKSVINQVYRDIEFIVIDGDSTDQTKSILNKYSDSFSTYISEPDNGIYNAMNKGVQHAIGDYVFFLNADDAFCDAYVIRDVADLLMANKEIDFLHGKIVRRKDLTHPFELEEKNIPYTTELKSPDDVKEFLITDCLSHQASFARRELFTDDSVGLFDESYKIVGDYHWFARMTDIPNIKIAYTDRNIANFYAAGVSNSASVVERLKERFPAIDTVYGFQTQKWLKRRVEEYQKILINPKNKWGLSRKEDETKKNTNNTSPQLNFPKSKEEVFSIFDSVYVLNLEASADRRIHINNDFNRIGIDKYEFFKASTPKDKEVLDLFSEGRVIGYPYCFRCGKTPCDCTNNYMLPPQIANRSTFIRIWKDMVENNKKFCLLCEDDITFIDNVKDVLFKALSLQNFKERNIDISKPLLFRMASSGGFHHTQNNLRPPILTKETFMSNPCYAINLAMAKLLLRNSNMIIHSSDVFVHKQIPNEYPEVQAFTIRPLVATELSWNSENSTMPSTIFAKGINEEDKKRKKQQIIRVSSHKEYVDALTKQGVKINYNFDSEKDPSVYPFSIILAGLEDLGMDMFIESVIKDKRISVYPDILTSASNIEFEAGKIYKYLGDPPSTLPKCAKVIFVHTNPLEIITTVDNKVNESRRKYFHERGLEIYEDDEFYFRDSLRIEDRLNQWMSPQAYDLLVVNYDSLSKFETQKAIFEFLQKTVVFPFNIKKLESWKDNYKVHSLKKVYNKILLIGDFDFKVLNKVSKRKKKKKKERKKGKKKVYLS